MVMIQVLIAEVTLNNIDEFGVELGLQDSLLFDRGLLGDLLTTTQTTQTTSPGGAVTSVTQDTIQAATLTPGFLFNNLALGDSGSDQSLSTRENTAAQGLSHFAVNRTNSELGFGGFVFSASSESVSVLMRALKENRRLDVLSRPQVMTLDNQPAFIQVGQRVPRITGTTINETGQVNTIQLENVGIILGVTPRISPDGLVVMEIDAEKSDVGPESEGIPISIAADGQVIRSPRINTTTAQTTISASSGQTVVLGGLITKSKSETHRKVPFIGDLPLLGHLFRYDSEVARRTELLIIMTPRVVNNEQDSEIIKQVESSRMNWVLSDVVDLHGPSGLRSRTDEWGDDETNVIYPGMDEVWPEEIAPEPTIIMPNGQLPGPSGAPSRLQPTPADASPAEGARGESLPLPEGGAWKSGGRSVLRQPQLIKRTGHEEPIPNQPIHRASYDRPMRLPPTR
jgi:type II secretory pathway component GspD/PulD (secretin)